MPKVWNKRDPQLPADAYYVGRPTQYGNTYTHLHLARLKRVSSREEAVDLHEIDLLNRLDREPDFKEKLILDLKGKDLICWCAPFGGMEFNDPRKICHAQALGRIANS